MSDPVGIRSLLVELAAKFGIGDAAETVRLFAAWERIVGPQVASRCRPEVLKDGVLKVRTSSPAWAAEVKYLSAQIARRVNDEVGKELVREVKVSVEREEAARGRGRRPVRDRAEDAGRSGPAQGDKRRPAPLRSEPSADPEKVVAPIGEKGLAEATKRALLAAKTRKNRGQRMV